MNAHPTAEAEPSAAEAHASGASGSGRRVARGMAWVPWLGTGIDTARQVGAFTLIAFGTLATQRRHATRVIGPMVQAQVARSGVRVLPIICFLGVAIGAGLGVVMSAGSATRKKGGKDGGGGIQLRFQGFGPPDTRQQVGAADGGAIYSVMHARIAKEGPHYAVFDIIKRHALAFHGHKPRTPRASIAFWVKGHT